MRTLEARFSWLLVNPWAMLDPLSYCMSLFDFFHDSLVLSAFWARSWSGFRPLSVKGARPNAIGPVAFA